MPQHLTAEFGKSFTTVDKPRFRLLTDCDFICMSTSERDREPVGDKIISESSRTLSHSGLKDPARTNAPGVTSSITGIAPLTKRQGKKWASTKVQPSWRCQERRPRLRRYQVQFMSLGMRMYTHTLIRRTALSQRPQITS
jgi:hypothetical protein